MTPLARASSNASPELGVPVPGGLDGVHRIGPLHEEDGRSIAAVPGDLSKLQEMPCASGRDRVGKTGAFTLDPGDALGLDQHPVVAPGQLEVESGRTPRRLGALEGPVGQLFDGLLGQGFPKEKVGPPGIAAYQRPLRGLDVDGGPGRLPGGGRGFEPEGGAREHELGEATRVRQMGADFLPGRGQGRVDYEAVGAVEEMGFPPGAGGGEVGQGWWVPSAWLQRGGVGPPARRKGARRRAMIER